jgi:hypothetical protein
MLVLPRAAEKMVAIIRLMMAAGLVAMLACPRDATAQTNGPCRQEMRALCPNLEPEHGAMQRCLQEHLGDLSSSCRAHLQRGVERARTPARPDHTGAGRAKTTGE